MQAASEPEIGWERLRASALVRFTSADREAFKRVGALLAPSAVPPLPRMLTAFTTELGFTLSYLEYLGDQQTATSLTREEIALSRLAAELASELVPLVAELREKLARESTPE